MMTDKNYNTDYSELKKLAWGKFERYTTALFPSGTWRIGSIADGSCFFHSIMTSINKNYRGIKNRAERIDHITAVRGKISKKITLDTWENLQHGEPAHFAFLQQINDIEGGVAKYMHNPAKYQKSKSREWIRESINHDTSAKIINIVLGGSLFDMNDFSTTCSAASGYISMDKCEDVFVKIQLKVYVKKIGKKLKQLTETYQSGDIEASVLDYKVLLENIAANAKTSALKSIVSHFANPREWIGTEYLEFLSNQFNTNIFIINGTNGMPYIQGDTTAIKEGRSSIFLLNVGESHYETLGFEIVSSDKPKIKCRLSWTHPVVQKLVNLGSKKTASKEVLFNTVYGKVEEVVKEEETEEVEEEETEEVEEEETEEVEEEEVEEEEVEKEKEEEDIWMSEKEDGVFSNSDRGEMSDDEYSSD
jgi:hypothetical protein